MTEESSRPGDIRYGFDVEQRLFVMIKAGETLTEIQWDFYALHIFSWQFPADGLGGFVFNPYFYLLQRLPEAMDRHHLPHSAAILREVRSLFPPGTIERGESGLGDFWRSLDDTERDEIEQKLSQYDDELQVTDDDYWEAAATIARERTDELPDPQQPLPHDDAPEEWTINPFTGEPMKIKRR